jgi:hypothetical protein
MSGYVLDDPIPVGDHVAVANSGVEAPRKQARSASSGHSD